MDISKEKQIIMRKLITLLFIGCCLSCHGQYRPKKHKKDPKDLNTKLLTIGGGLMFITAGTISMNSKGLRPFQDNGTKWRTSPSEWAIIGGFGVLTFGIIYKF
jgi:hypothetical protein